jgi:hypothetical protein
VETTHHLVTIPSLLDELASEIPVAENEWRHQYYAAKMNSLTSKDNFDFVTNSHITSPS